MPHPQFQRRTRPLQRWLLLLPLLLCHGCYYAVIYVAVTKNGSSSSGGSFNNSPSLSLNPVARQNGSISFGYTVTDGESNPVALSVEVFQGGTKLFDATDAGAGQGSEGNTGLSSSPGGTDHIFVWDSVADFGDQITRQDLQLRVSINDGQSSSAAVTSNIFQINNTIPTVTLESSSFPTMVTGNLVMAFTIIDPDVETVDVNIRISGDGGVSFRSIPDSAVVAGARAGLQGNVQGVRHSLAINLAEPSLFPGRSLSDCIIELNGQDLFALGPTILSPPFAVANNNAPSVLLQGNNDDSQDVSVVFTVSDFEAINNTGTKNIPLTNNQLGEVLVADFLSISNDLPIIPGTLLIRYDGGKVLKDVDQGNGLGRLVSLTPNNPQNPSPNADAFINYSTGVFSGPGSITVQGIGTNLVTADINGSFVIVESVNYDDLRDNAGFQPCTSLVSSETAPFPLFVDTTGVNKTFIWDTATDLDFGNSQFVTVEISINDGDNQVRRQGNNFLVNNGPVGENNTIPASGAATEIRQADLNNDGFIDALVINDIERSLSIFLGNGSSFAPVINQFFPIPQGNGQNLIQSPALGLRPAGALNPNRFTLLDVNQDGILDITIANTSPAPEQDGSEHFANVMVYFGLGNGQFDLAKPWGPFPIGGRDPVRVQTVNTNDDNGDGKVDSNDTEDLVIVSRFSHDPVLTRSRQGIPRDQVQGEALDNTATASAPYTLTGDQLNSLPIRPGSVTLSFDSLNNPTVVDIPLDDLIVNERYGVLMESLTGIELAYIRYSDGQLLDQFQGAPLGPLTGQTSFSLQSATSPTAQYDRVINASDLINDAAFIKNSGQALQPGDQIFVRGFGHKGLSLDAQGHLISQTINGALTVGTGPGQVSSFQDLLGALTTLYQPEVFNPATQFIQSSIDSEGRINLRLTDSNLGEEVLFTTTAAITLSDSRGNQWPLFEDPFGRITIYHTRPNGGFFAPNLSRETLPFSPYASRADSPALLPPGVTGSQTGALPSAGGPGTILQQALADRFGPNPGVADLVALSRGRIQFPYSISSAGGALPILADPNSAPDFMETGLGPTGSSSFSGGINPTTVEGARIFTNPAQNLAPDLASPCSGDGSIPFFLKVPTSVASAILPSLISSQYFQFYDYLDGLYLNQSLSIVTLFNSQIAASGSSSFISPGSVRRLNVNDFSGDSFNDLIIVAGSFTILAKSRIANPPPSPQVPFDISFGVVTLAGGDPGLGDLNSDGLTDIALPSTGTQEVLALLQVAPISETLSGATNAPVILSGMKLTQLEKGRAIVFPDSFELRFHSGGVVHALQRVSPGSSSDFSLKLIQDPDGAAQELQSGIAGFNPQSGDLVGTTGVSVESPLIARYDQLFQKDFINNVNIVNFKAIRFATTPGPAISFVQDLNSDKLPDLLTLSSLTNTLNLRFQIKESPLNNFIPVPAGKNPISVVEGNFISGNGSQEIAVSNGGSNTISIYVPDAVNGLRLVQELPIFVSDPGNPGQRLNNTPLPLLPFNLTKADFDGDGDDDIVVTSIAMGGAASFNAFVPAVPERFDGGWVLIPGLSQTELNSGSQFRATVIGLAFTNAFDVTALDVNNDGLLDIVVTNIFGSNFSPGHLSFYLNQGGSHPIFGGPNFGNLTTAPGLTPFLAAPLGDPILPGRIYVQRAAFPIGISAGDLDGDGFKELVVGTAARPQRGIATIDIYRGIDPNNPPPGTPVNEIFEFDPNAVVAGNFKVSFVDVSPITNGSTNDVKMADLNMDGKLDIVFGDQFNAARAGIMFNTTTGPGQPLTFNQVPLLAAGQPAGLAIGDVNSDGVPDIVISSTDSFIAIYLNDPLHPGTFSAPIFQPCSPGSFDIAIVDIDGDGKNDVIASNSGSDLVNVFRQR
ncbi:MAG: VCBS repeat-containing protein [Planctomycetota bacterium]|nr:VCBS repeat-containing protein [Planctomycetota bacterium]